MLCCNNERYNECVSVCVYECESGWCACLRTHKWCWIDAVSFQVCVIRLQCTRDRYTHTQTVFIYNRLHDMWPIHCSLWVLCCTLSSLHTNWRIMFNYHAVLNQMKLNPILFAQCIYDLGTTHMHIGQPHSGGENSLKVREKVYSSDLLSLRMVFDLKIYRAFRTNNHKMMVMVSKKIMWPKCLPQSFYLLNGLKIRKTEIWGTCFPLPFLTLTQMHTHRQTQTRARTCSRLKKGKREEREREVVAEESIHLLFRYIQRKKNEWISIKSLHMYARVCMKEGGKYLYTINMIYVKL